MSDQLARDFWNRVDSRLNGRSMKDLCEKCHLNYSSIRNRKSGTKYQLPRIETGFIIANELGVSLEYLLTGSDDLGPFNEFIPYLKAASEGDLGSIRKILGMPEKKADGNSGIMAG